MNIPASQPLFQNPNQSAAAPKYRFILPATDSTLNNPYVEVTDSIYLLARLAIAVFLMMVYYLAVSNGETDSHDVIRLFLATLAILTTTLPLWYKFRGVGIFHPLYITAAIAFLQGTLPAIGIYANGLDFHPVLGHSPRKMATLQQQVMLFAMCGTICTYIGFWLSKGIGWRFIAFHDRKSTLFFASFIGLIVGSIALYLLMELSGGFNYHLTNMNRGHAAKIWVKDAKYASIYANLIRLTSIAPAAWILVGKRPFVNPLFWVLAAYAVAASFLVNGRRSTILMIVLILVACWILRRKSLALGRLAIVGVLLFLVIGTIGQFRQNNRRTNSNLNFDAFTATNLENALQASAAELEGRNGASPVYPIVAKVPSSRHPYKLGMNYVNYINRFIPRLIWRDKPRGIGVETAETFYGRYNLGGIPPGRLGEAYWSGGLFGVVIVFTLWGVFLRSAGSFFLRFKKSSLACILYLATVTRLGPSEPEFRAWLYLIGPAVILFLLMGAMKPSTK